MSRDLPNLSAPHKPLPVACTPVSEGTPIESRRALSILYLDASAITKLVIDKPETTSLQNAVRGHDLVSSRVAVVEVVKAVARANPDADPTRLLALLAFVELDAELAALAGAIGEPGLRALDAIHVASALRLGSEVGAFIG